MDGRGWSAGLRKMETGTKAAGARMASGMAGAIGGVFAVGFLVSATRRIVAHADQVHKTAQRIGSSTETIQKFDFAATQSGASMGDVEKAFINTAKAMESAKQGLTTHIRAFDAFGITMQMLNVMSPEEVFLKVAAAIEKAGGAMDKAKSLQDIMGRGGNAMIPAFISGFTGLAASAPQGIDSQTIENLVRFNDELDRLKREILPGAAEAVSLLASVLEVSKKGQTRDSGLPSTGMGLGGLFTTPVLLAKTIPDIVAGVMRDLKEPTLGERRNFTAGIMGIKNVPLGPQNEIQNADTAAAAAAKAWSKPSLQLNSLQRIGAAVSQSSDPIAIERSNNKLLTAIARNTKKSADSDDN